MFVAGNQRNLLFEGNDIMNSFGQYLLSICVAAILCSILLQLLHGKGPASSVGKMLCGIFLLFTVLQPIMGFSVGDLMDLGEFVNVDASEAVLVGETEARRQWESIIKSQVEAYILDKAAQWDGDLSVEVSLSDGEIPIPIGVTISGNISPYGRAQLQAMISEQLGIAKENQIWT